MNLNQLLITSYSKINKAFLFKSTNALILAGVTELTDTIPSDVKDGDFILSFLMHRSTLIIPLGWSLVSSVDCTGTGTIQTLSIVKKDNATPSDSNTQVTFNQITPNRFLNCFMVIRSSTNNLSIEEIKTNYINDMNTYIITPDTLTSEIFGEIFINAGTVINASTSYISPLPLPGFMLTSGGSDNARLLVSYKEVNRNYSNSGDINLQPGTPESVTGINSIILRIKPL